MLSINDAIKILNKNKTGKKYNQEQAKQILQLLYQFGEIAFEQFKQAKNEECNTICKGID